MIVLNDEGACSTMRKQVLNSSLTSMVNTGCDCAYGAMQSHADASQRCVT